MDVYVLRTRQPPFAYVCVLCYFSVLLLMLHCLADACLPLDCGLSPSLSAAFPSSLLFSPLFLHLPRVLFISLSLPEREFVQFFANVPTPFSFSQTKQRRLFHYLFFAEEEEGTKTTGDTQRFLLRRRRRERNNISRAKINFIPYPTLGRAITTKTF